MPTKYATRDCITDVDLQEMKGKVVCAAPHMEVGIIEGRYYMVDHTLRTITRVTRGVYQHLQEHWSAMNFA